MNITADSTKVWRAEDTQEHKTSLVEASESDPAQARSSTTNSNSLVMGHRVWCWIAANMREYHTVFLLCEMIVAQTTPAARRSTAWW